MARRRWIKRVRVKVNTPVVGVEADLERAQDG